MSSGGLWTALTGMVTPPPAATVPTSVSEAVASAASKATSMYPDYSITVPTVAGEGTLDWCLSWFMAPIEYLHDPLGLPWWAAIVTASVALRVFTARVYFKSLRSGAHLQQYTAEMQEYQKLMKEARGNDERMREVVAAYRAFMKEKDINPFAFIKPMLIQMPIFIGAFTGLRRFARDAHLTPGFMDGGIGPFVALHLPDPSFVLPLTSFALSAAAIWANPATTGIASAELTPNGQRLLFSTLSGVFMLAALSWPAALQLYFGVTGGTMLAQQLLLRSQGFRNLMGFPADWPPSPEKAAEAARRRNDSMFKGMAPVFRRFSHLAALDFKRAVSGEPLAPQQVYVSRMGLRDPGVPPPPEELPPAFMAAASAPAGAAAAAPLVTATKTVSAAASLLSKPAMTGAVSLSKDKPKKTRK